MLDLHSCPGIVVFSGGSAANALVDTYKSLAEARLASLSYIIPISDNGGSSSELIRVFGGPGIGDLRSRLVRLIPDDALPGSELAAIRSFFSHRLPNNHDKARLEWLDFVEGRHPLWHGMSSAKKELIRSFLNLLNMEMVKRLRPSSVFNFEKASIGNLFVTGARLFCGSLESAIFLLSSICVIPGNVSVLPVINTMFTHHICAGLANGETITGQNSISHPTESSAVPSFPQGLPPVTPAGELEDPLRSETEEADSVEDANWPGSLPALRKQYINFTKLSEGGSDDLPARIERIWYINPYGQEIRPLANPKIIETTESAQAIVYSIGSLYTSLVPCLILRGVGNAIAMSIAREKILILNGSFDREVGPSSDYYSAMDFVKAIGRACNESRGIFGRSPHIEELRQYVTHLIFIEGDGVPHVSKADFAAAGIETIRVYGRRAPNGEGWRYDTRALAQALEAVVGRRPIKADVSRRNTLRN